MIELLRKSGVALCALAFALVAQIPHAAHVFAHGPYLDAIVQPRIAWNEALLSYAYAIALESATLIFVVHGHRRASYGFALASFAINLSYYAMSGVYLWAWRAFPDWLLSALLPIGIASFSHILTGAQDVQMQLPGWAARAWSNLRGGAKKLTPPSEIIQTPIQTHAAAQIENEQSVQSVAQDDAQPIDARTQALQMHSNEMPAAEIARILQQKESTVRSWIRRSNGAKAAA